MTTNPPKVQNPVVTFESDMMTNYSASSPVSCSKPIAAVLDTCGNPIVISIGTDDELWIVYQDPASPTGWSQQDLTTGLASDVTVVAVGAAQASTGEFCIAIAVAPSSGQTTTPVYITDWLSNDLSGVDWASFATTRWVLRTPEVPVDVDNLSAGTQSVTDATVEQILMGAGSTTATAPLIVVAASQNGTDLHWFVNGCASDASWSWAVYAMPEDADQILDMCVGYLSQGLGTYVLYTLGSVTNLIFTTATKPVGSQDIAYTHFLTPPSGARCLAALPDPVSPHYSNLFVGGDGVSYFDHSTQPLSPPFGGEGVMVITADQLSNVQQITLAQDSASVSLWVLDQATQNLSYTTGPQNSVADSVWTAPLVLQAHVAHMAALRQPTLQANQIVTALSDDSLAYQWQDPTTTLWRSTNIPLSDLEDDPIQAFSSYTSHIHLAGEDGNALPGVEVSITASQWAYVSINGFAYELGPSTPAQVRTDVMGNITIIAQTATLSTPIYQVQLAGGPLNTVNPSTNAVARLGQIQTGADLQAVTLPDGSKLLPAGTTDGAADLGAVCIKNLVAYMATLPADGSPVSDSGNASDQTWGGTVDNGQMQPYTGSAADMLGTMPQSEQLAMTATTDDGLVGTVLGIAGDTLRFISTAIKDVEALVFNIAKGVLRLAIKIAGQWICIALRALGDVLEAINWVLSLLGLTLEEILQWLGFDFGWDDILQTAAVFNNLTEQTVDMLGATAVGMQKVTNTLLNALVEKVDSLGSYPLLPTDVASTNVVSTASGAQASSSQGQQACAFTTNSAGGNFIYYQLLHGGILDASIADTFTLPSEIQDYVQNVVLPALAEVSEEVLSAVRVLVTGVQQGTLTIGDVVGLVTKTLAEVVIEVLQVLIDGLFTVVEVLVGALKSLLFTPIDIPFLTPLYKLLTGFDSMTLAGGLTLLVAIPSTVAYRIVKGSAPFADSTYGLDTVTWQQVFGDIAAKLGAPTLTQVAGTSHGEFSDGATIYSEIGGLVSLCCNFVSEICTVLGVLSEGASKAVSIIGTVTSFVDLAATLPLDTNVGQEILGVLAYTLLFFDGCFQLCMIGYSKPSKGSPAAHYVPESGLLEGVKLAPVEEVLKGGYETFMGLATLILDAISFLAEMVEDDSGDRGMDVGKFLQNICGAVTTIGNGTAAVAGDENPEYTGPALIAAAIGWALYEIIGVVRVVDTIDAGVLYQPS